MSPVRKSEEIKNQLDQNQISLQDQTEKDSLPLRPQFQ